MNFDIKCSIEEAENIAEHITVNITMAAATCYSGVFNKTKPDNDKRWKHYRALSTVYIKSPKTIAIAVFKANKKTVEKPPFLVGVTRLELATPRPPVWCATTCATPRNIKLR